MGEYQQEKLESAANFTHVNYITFQTFAGNAHILLNTLIVE